MSATTSDGVALHVERVEASGARRGTIVCLHAMMTDGRYFYPTFAPMLAAEGYDVFVADFRGHGRSQAMRDWSFDDLVELDLPAILSVTGTDVTLLGHSLGGLVACAALGTGRIPKPRRLALIATSVWLGETLPRRMLMRTYRTLARTFGKAPVRALRAGTADEAKTYVEQLSGWALARRWTSLRGIDYTAQLARIDVPALAICGGGDWMCRPADARAIAEPVRAPLEVIPGASHFSLFSKYADLVVKKLCH